MAEKLVQLWLLTLKFSNETVKLTSWPRDVTINFQDTLIENDAAATDHTFRTANGLAAVRKERRGASSIPRSPLVLTLVDLNRVRSNRLELQHLNVKLGLWTSTYSDVNGQGTFSAPRTRYKGKSVVARAVPGQGALYMEVKFVGSLQQITTVSPVRAVVEQQRSPDNGMDHVARTYFLRWGGKL